MHVVVLRPIIYQYYPIFSELNCFVPPHNKMKNTIINTIKATLDYKISGTQAIFPFQHIFIVSENGVE